MVDRYIRVMCPSHPRANRDGYVYEHTLVAERALGRVLPIGAEVHHFNEVKTDNRRENLVICPDHKYHALLHTRMNALKASGNPNWRKCAYCKTHSDPTEMAVQKHKVQDNQYYHIECQRAYRKERRILNAQRV